MEAMQRIPWGDMYGGFRPRGLFPGAPVFPKVPVVHWKLGNADLTGTQKPQITLVMKITMEP